MRLPRITTKQLMIAVAAMALVFAVVRYCDYLQYRDLNFARQLESAKGVADVQIHAYYEDLSYEVRHVSFTLADRPDVAIHIDGLTLGLLGEPEHIYLASLGPWSFHERSYGYGNAYDLSGNPIKSVGYCDAIDVGSAGEYASMLPVKIRNLSDLATHYDELNRYFSSWPDDKHWGRFPSLPDMERAYCATPLNTGLLSPPAGFPDK